MPRRSPSALVAFFLSLAAFALAPALVHAEVLWSDAGFYLDLPEGFEYVDGDKKTRFAFLSPDKGMEVNLFSYGKERYPTADACSADVLKKLASKGEAEAFRYQGRDCVFAELSFSVGGAAKKGYAFFSAPAAPRAAPPSGGVPGGTAPGTLPGGSERTIALLAYTDARNLVAYADFIFSTLDSFSADRAALRAPGPVSQYLLAWPPIRGETKRVKFGGSEFDLPWSAEEASHEEEIAAREFRVLQAYGDTQDLWKTAWARSYRMIYRESAARLDRLSIELDRLLPDDPTEVARRLLAWTQGFVYERNLEGADFVDPLSAACEARGDCDSRAMVAAIILERRGIDAILMVSDAYSHALLGVDVPGGGQRFPFDGKNWLVGETTANVGLGMIAADQKDWSKWLGIKLAQ